MRELTFNLAKIDVVIIQTRYCQREFSDGNLLLQKKDFNRAQTNGLEPVDQFICQPQCFYEMEKMSPTIMPHGGEVKPFFGSGSV
jgi:hypothetical protein